jgi:hypothetical protein
VLERESGARERHTVPLPSTELAAAAPCWVASSVAAARRLGARGPGSRRARRQPRRRAGAGAGARACRSRWSAAAIRGPRDRAPSGPRLTTLAYVRDGRQDADARARRAAGDHHAGRWNGLGGKFEPGESPEAACRARCTRSPVSRSTTRSLKGFITFPAFDDRQRRGTPSSTWSPLLGGRSGPRGPRGTLHWVPTRASRPPAVGRRPRVPAVARTTGRVQRPFRYVTRWGAPSIAPGPSVGARRTSLPPRSSAPASPDRTGPRRRCARSTSPPTRMRPVMNAIAGLMRPWNSANRSSSLDRDREVGALGATRRRSASRRPRARGRRVPRSRTGRRRWCRRRPCRALPA